ncbi:hypothetical protein EV368DRAFT_82140 [Lentinula lateritia]|nr:hypothetical protein EV368DRAFT_82140 [Lentinula lateritia]
MSRRSLRIQVKAMAIQEHTVVPKEPSAAITKAGRKRVRGSTSEGLELVEREEKGRPPRKKSRKGTSKITQPSGGMSVERFKNARGKLERLAKDVPLDVIFCHLDPGDLLRLARTSKDLRGLLMSKSSEAIWRVARANVEGLPPRPNDLNEPQYARLIYDAYCYVCNHKGRCENVLWRFRARVCKNCVVTMLPLYNDDYLDKQPPEYRNSDILPSEVVWVGNTSMTVASNKWAARYKAEYDALETPADREQWIRQKQKDLQEIREHSHLCRKWNKNRLDQRAIELNNLRDHRKTDILARLGKLGWHEEVEHMEKRGMYRTHEQIYFEYARIVNQPRNLTEEGWVNIKDELVELLSNHRTARLEIDTGHVIRARYVQLSQAYQRINSKSDCREPLPAIGDIFTANVFENLIWDTPVEEQVDFSAKLSEHLPHFIDKWRLAKIQELLTLLQKSKRGSTLPVHLAESHKETVILDTPTSIHTSDLGDIQEHWYFNPRRPIQSLHRKFYSSAPSLRVASQES